MWSTQRVATCGISTRYRLRGNGLLRYQPSSIATKQMTIPAGSLQSASECCEVLDSVATEVTAYLIACVVY
ncbi:hypothetical protein SFRURICE_006964 [Spodoptera frugiperda]|nr:hypothetical protein SFRURICE_006964 [Spodoptera frugiperda]